MEILGSFGKDIFIGKLKTTTPMIVVPTGYEDIVYVNGMSLSALQDSSAHHTNAEHIGEGSISGTKYTSVRLYTEGNSNIGSDPSTLIAYNAYNPSKQNYINPDSSTYFRTSDSSLFISSVEISTGNVSSKIINLNEFQYGDLTGNNMIFGNMNMLHIHIDSSTAFSFTIDATTNKPDASESLTYDYDPGLTDSEKYKKVDKMVDNETSYELLRANPKLTGNVKVVVDSSLNMYLDTFKVSKGLSQSRYRKVPINPDEYYGRLLMSRYSSMPSTDFYKIEDSCYSMFSIANNLGDQYYDTYNMGVRTNGDEMYSENFSMLAPLYINKKMPDFFIIFKVKNYENLGDNNERIKYFLSNGEIVKVFDMRRDTDLGKFMRNVYEQAKDYVGDLYVSYDYDKSNIYNGISIDRGVVSQIYESASLERSISNQVAMNDWYTLGFERNRVVSKNIVNFEFMFDDPSENLFSINTYFGLYVRLNGEDNDFHCIGFTGTTPTFDSSISGVNFNPSVKKYSDLIYALTTPTSFERLRLNVTSEDITNPVRKYINKPYKNIALPKVLDFGENFDNKYYISLVINTLLDPGEHYRVVDTIRKVIYDVVISNYTDERFNISEIDKYTVENEDGQYQMYRTCIYNIPYRITSLDDTENIDDVRSHEADLMAAAFNMFDDERFKAYSNGNDTVSIVYTSVSQNSDVNLTGILFEKVSSFYAMNHDEFVLEDEYSDKSTSIFGHDNDQKIHLDPLENSTKYLYPYGFEALGHRFAYVSAFIPLLDGNRRAYVIDQDITDFINNEKSPLFKTQTGYSIYNGFKHYTLDSSLNFFEHTHLILPGFGESTNYIIVLDTTPYTVKGCIPFYSNYPLNAGICSIFPVKDIFMDVLDTENNISANVTDYITDNSGEYTKTNNIYSHALSSKSEESVMDYFDKYERYTSYKDSSGNTIEINTLNTSNLTNYLSVMNAGNHKLSDISMLAPYCCKWKSVGTNAAGTPLRVMFDYDINSVNKSYFIPTDASSYIGHVTITGNNNKSTFRITGSTYDFPTLEIGQCLVCDDKTFMIIKLEGVSIESHEYIQGNVTVTGTIDANTHRIYLASDTSEYLNITNITNIESTTGYSKYLNDYLESRIHTTFRDYLIYGEGSLDDLIVNENHGKAVMSKVYSYGDDTIEFISGGIKVRFTFNNDSIIKTSKYNGYSAMTVCCAGNCPDGLHPCEIIVDEVHEQIMFIIYNGSSAKHLIYNKYNNPGAANDDLNKIEPAYAIYKTSPISDTRIIYIGSQKSSLLHDDASMGYTDSQLIGYYPSNQNYYGALIVTSPVYYIESFDKDKFILSTSKLKWYDPSNNTSEQVGKYYPSDYVPEYFVSTDPLLFVDSSSIVTSTTNMNKFGDKLYDNVDAFVVRDGSTNIILMPDSSLSAPASLPLWKVKTVLNNPTLYVKTESQTFNYTDLPNIVNIEIVDPSDITRENEDFEQNSVTGKVIPSFCEPVTKDIFEYEESIPELNTIFNKSFDGCDVRIKDVNILDQIWIRKMSKNPLTITKAANMVDVDEIVVTCETLYDSSISVGDRLIDPMGRTYYVSQVNAESSIISHIHTNRSGEFEDKASAEKQLAVGQTLIDPSTGECIIIDSSLASFDTVSKQLTEGYFTVTGEIASDSSLYTTGTNAVYLYVSDSSTQLTKTIVMYSIENVVVPTNGIFINTTQNATFDIRVVDSYTTKTAQTLSYKTIISTTGFSILHNINPMIDCWHANIYRNFSGIDEYVEMNGISSGYEKNTFLTSRGINLYGSINSASEEANATNTIEITHWKDVKVDATNREITLNVTDSLLKYILSSEGYMKNWIGVYDNNPQNMIRYVKNTVMKYIDITKYITFELYRRPSSSLKMSSPTSYAEFNKIDNFENSLTISKGKYYMKLENLDTYEYAAKLTIKL